MKWKKIILIFYFLTIFIISLFIINIINIENKHKCNILKNNYIYKLDKIIIVGDSRMELIEYSRDKMKLPKSITFDARSGARISWLYSDGIPRLYELIENKNYKYHVIFNLGVNDLNSDNDPNKIAKEYFEAYKKIINNNDDISFYILSVNPIDENKIYRLFSKENKRTTEKVETFNEELIKLIDKENLKYCDSYNSLKFELPDGLHYDFETDKSIMKYIIENCVNY